jgi:hypothetical protein
MRDLRADEWLLEVGLTAREISELRFRRALQDTRLREDLLVAQVVVPRIVLPDEAARLRVLARVNARLRQIVLDEIVAEDATILTEEDERAILESPRRGRGQSKGTRK